MSKKKNEVYESIKQGQKEAVEFERGNLPNAKVDIMTLGDGTTPIPNADTIAAMKESEEICRNPHLYKSYGSIDEILADMESDCDDCGDEYEMHSESDPFYSEENQKRLLQATKQLEQGGGKVRDLIDNEDSEENL